MYRVNLHEHNVEIIISDCLIRNKYMSLYNYYYILLLTLMFFMVFEIVENSRCITLVNRCRFTCRPMENCNFTSSVSMCLCVLFCFVLFCFVLLMNNFMYLVRSVTQISFECSR